MLIDGTSLASVSRARAERERIRPEMLGIGQFLTVGSQLGNQRALQKGAPECQPLRGEDLSSRHPQRWQG